MDITLGYIKKYWISIAAIVVILIVLYHFYDLLRERPEPGEANAAGSDYAPVSYNSVKTNNFHISEMTCKDGSKVPDKYTGNALRVLQNLQVLREAYSGHIIMINSGYRSPAHNASVGGAGASAHLRALACDIVVIGVSPVEVRKKIRQLIAAGKMQPGGIGAYANFTHYDVSKPRSWGLPA